jgi:hypothetical protein
MGLQALIDLGLGALAQMLIALLDHPNQLLVLARDLLEVVLGELIPRSSEMLSDLRPLLGERPWSYTWALPTRRLCLRHPRSSCGRPRPLCNPCPRRHSREALAAAPIDTDQRTLYPKSRTTGGLRWAVLSSQDVTGE